MQVLRGDGIYLKLATGFALLGMVAGLAASLAAPRQYTSSATLLVAPALEQPLLLAIQNVASRPSLSEIISRKDLDLYHRERSQMPLEDVIANMNHDLQIHLARDKGSGVTVGVNFHYRDPRAAQATVDAIVNKLNRESKLTIVQAASLPTTPTSRNLLTSLLAGMSIGLLLGWFIALSVRQPRRTLLVSGMGLAGCVLGAGFSLLIPNRYVSRAVIRVVPGNNLSAEVLKSLQRASAKLEASQEHGLHFQFVDVERSALEITFESTDPYKAQAKVSSAVSQLIDANQGLKNVELLDGANLPQSPSFPNRMVIAGIGLASGLLLGAIFVLGSRRRQFAFG